MPGHTLKERRRIEEDLRVSQDRYRTLADSLREGLYYSRNGMFTSVNPAMCDMFGYRKEELVGMPAWHLATPESREWVKEEFFSMASSGRFRPIQTECLRADGTPISVEVRISGRTGDGGVFGLVLDITEQRRLERELLEISERERRSIGYNLHDDIGQRLTALKLICHVLFDKLRKDGNQHAADARDLSGMADDILVRVRKLVHGLELLEPGADGLAMALREMSRHLDAWTSAVDVRYFQRGRGEVWDRNVANHLYRIAQEAASNALRHAGATRIRIGLDTRNRAATVSIEDDGAGTLEPDSVGPGMGLRIMKFRAQEAGGTLSLSSTPGQGTTVRCSCPNPKPAGGEPGPAKVPRRETTPEPLRAAGAPIRPPGGHTRRSGRPDRARSSPGGKGR